MRLGLLPLVFIATLFGSGFWYTHIDTTCRVPIAYHVGDIDSRFGTSAEEIKRIAKQAEAVWENPLSEELFIYDEANGIPINLVFDERQEKAVLEAEIREDLDAKEGMTEAVSTQYEKLIAEFRLLKKEYEARVISYESKLKEYNAEVAEWNSKGGAPKEELEKLQKTEHELTQEQYDLEKRSGVLNDLVTKLNGIGARGNTLIKDYNTIVEEYNEQFSEGHEFTQGDYAGDAIHIYQFDSDAELTIVLGHEFGHALSLGHVQNEESIMYHTMESQTSAEITAEDRAEFTRVCREMPLIARIARTIFSMW